IQSRCKRPSPGEENAAAALPVIAYPGPGIFFLYQFSPHVHRLHLSLDVSSSIHPSFQADVGSREDFESCASARLRHPVCVFSTIWAGFPKLSRRLRNPPAALAAIMLSSRNQRTHAGSTGISKPAHRRGARTPACRAETRLGACGPPSKPTAL